MIFFYYYPGPVQTRLIRQSLTEPTQRIDWGLGICHSMNHSLSGIETFKLAQIEQYINTQ